MNTNNKGFEDRNRTKGLLDSAGIAVLDRIKDEFLQTLSHELKTPLNVIIGWVDVLDSDELTHAERRRALEMIRRSALTQSQLVNDLLEVSGMVAGKLSLDVENISLREIVESCMGSLESTWKAKNLNVSLRCNSEAKIAGDKERLTRMVCNLLANALKFTPEDGRVVVTCIENESSVLLSVEDTGHGIEPEFLPHIFEKFRQENGTITRTHGGLGLGLSIVKYIVELHGGSISVESRGRGMGTKFVVQLPRAARSSNGAGYKSSYDQFETRIQEEAELKVLSGLTILIAEDDVSTRTLISYVVRKHGARVIEVGTAHEAWNVLNSHRVHALVSDIGMPLEDGYSLIRRVRQSAITDIASLPALALTAYAQEWERAAAISAGFDRHVAKPIRPRDLIQAVTLTVTKGSNNLTSSRTAHF